MMSAGFDSLGWKVTAVGGWRPIYSVPSLSASFSRRGRLDLLQRDGACARLPRSRLQ